MSSTRQINALDLLKQVVQKRNWYNGKTSRQCALQIKKRLEYGQVITHELVVEALGYAGWYIVQPETWAKKDI